MSVITNCVIVNFLWFYQIMWIKYFAPNMYENTSNQLFSTLYVELLLRL